MEKAEIKERDMKALSRYRKGLYAKPELNYLFLELTDSCNMNCRHCGSSCHDGNSRYLDKDLAIKALEEIAEDFKDADFMVCITGGEPLLHPAFDEILETVSRLKLPWGMTTNGILIDENRAERLKALKMGSITLSLDGLKESHEWLRRVPGSFEKTLEGIRNLKNAGFAVQVTTVVNRRNMGELEDIFHLMRDLDVDSWRVTNVDPMGRAMEEEGDLALHGDALITLLEFVREKRFDPDNPMEVCYGCAHYLSFEYEREVRDFYFQCGSGTVVASILCNGDIYGCLDVERRKELVQGNIAADRFSDVWFHGFKEYRRDRSTLCSPCTECTENAYCSGDSMHTWNFDRNEPRLCLKEILRRNGDER